MFVYYGLIDLLISKEVAFVTSINCMRNSSVHYHSLLSAICVKYSLNNLTILCKPIHFGGLRMRNFMILKRRPREIQPQDLVHSD